MQIKQRVRDLSAECHQIGSAHRVRIDHSLAGYRELFRQFASGCSVLRKRRFKAKAGGTVFMLDFQAARWLVGRPSTAADMTLRARTFDPDSRPRLEPQKGDACAATVCTMVKGGLVVLIEVRVKREKFV